MSFFSFNNFIFPLRLIKIKRQRSNGKEYGVKEVVECLTGVLFLHSAKIFRVLRIMSVGFLWMIGLDHKASLIAKVLLRYRIQSFHASPTKAKYALVPVHFIWSYLLFLPSLQMLILLCKSYFLALLLSQLPKFSL